jgi:hypothetical protein
MDKRKVKRAKAKPKLPVITYHGSFLLSDEDIRHDLQAMRAKANPPTETAAMDKHAINANQPKDAPNVEANQKDDVILCKVVPPKIKVIGDDSD